MQPDKYGPLTLESFEPLINAYIYRKVQDRSIWEDCRQEARIIAWRVMQDRPDKPRQYIVTSIKNRINTVSARGSMTGSTCPQGFSVDPLRRSHDSIDALATRGLHVAVSAESVDPQSDEHLTATIVRDAIRKLPKKQREHVAQVFYLGHSHRSASRSQVTWRRAKQALSESLADLAA